MKHETLISGWIVALLACVWGCSGDSPSEGSDPSSTDGSTSSTGNNTAGTGNSAAGAGSTVTTTPDDTPSTGTGTSSAGASSSTGNDVPSSDDNPSSSSGNASGTDDPSGTDDNASGTASTEKFSFFVTSYAALQRLSGSQNGFGGDLRFGETGAGAGLRGADLICAAIAETSMPGAGSKPWRAFLSASDGGDGQPVNAIDRIGQGPWYDRLGRLFGNTVAEVQATRPTTADSAIQNDFPNEEGTPNHQPDPTQGAVDNHDMLTGSDDTGHLYAADATCLDWTSASGNLATEGKPRVGHSWPRGVGNGGGRGGVGGGGRAGGLGNSDNWMSALTESGCAPGVNLIETGGPMANSTTVGSGGGYGGFYCFSLVP